MEEELMSMVEKSPANDMKATVPEAKSPNPSLSTERDLPEPKDHQDGTQKLWTLEQA